MRAIHTLPTSLLFFLSTLTHAADLEIITTHPRNCLRPTQAGDTIHVHYRGTLQSTGAEFDSSYSRNSPLTFTLGVGRVIAGWDQGLLEMCPGEERKLVIPPELAYGERGSPPVIPGGATLVFETKLVSIDGVEEEGKVEGSPTDEGTKTSTEAMFGIATAPSVPPEEHEVEEAETPTLEGKPLTSTAPMASMVQEAECHLLGSFALIVQGALGAVALLSLVVKRWREESKRPWKIWFFDVSKQVVGSMLTHILNLAMSMLGSVELIHAAKNAASKANAADAEGSNTQGERTTPNPCSFYLLNLAIDTTLGIPILYLLLKILYHAFLYTPLAHPKESIKSGHYGYPPRATWWLKQSLIYFIGLTGMKLFVWVLFALLPWLPWVGDWALRWTEGSEALQVAFVMFVFPLIMNGVQYWIIDNFIMDKTRGKSGSGGGEYAQVRQSTGDDDDEEDGSEVVVEAESVIGKDDEEGLAPLKEVTPTPIPDYEGGRKGGGSHGATPPNEEGR